MRYLGPVGVLIGIVAVVVGAMFQIFGAAPVVFCSTIGVGIVLIVLAGGYWAIRAFTTRTPRSAAV